MKTRAVHNVAHGHMCTHTHIRVCTSGRCDHQEAMPDGFSPLALSRLLLIHGQGAETESGFQLQPDLMLHYFAHLYTGYSVFNISS